MYWQCLGDSGKAPFKAGNTRTRPVQHKCGNVRVLVVALQPQCVGGMEGSGCRRMQAKHVRALTSEIPPSASPACNCCARSCSPATPPAAASTPPAPSA
eukprot:365650-Chlamydomonas_euryale.AAC.6